MEAFASSRARAATRPGRRLHLVVRRLRASALLLYLGTAIGWYLARGSAGLCGMARPWSPTRLAPRVTVTRRHRAFRTWVASTCEACLLGHSPGWRSRSVPDEAVFCSSG